MPVFKATAKIRDSIQAIDGDYSWNFHVTNPGASSEAWQDANELSQALAGILLPDTCTVYQVSIRNNNVLNGNQTRAVNIEGQRAVSGAPLPAWNVARVQFRTAVGLRPSTFYFRMGLTEDDVTGQNFSAGVVTALDNFITAVTAHGGFCAPSGAVFTSGGYDELMRMRQMGWHRRTRPGFRRGWVPV